MPTSKGRDAVLRLFDQIPEMFAGKLLPGAARAMVTVVADEVKARSISQEVSDAVKISVKREESQVIAKVMVKGRGAYIAPWLEYGTSGHFISVDVRQAAGRSVSRINKLNKEGKASLVIGGKFVGDTVYHPGARPHPFFRVSFDVKQREAFAAGQDYINTRVARMRSSGLVEAGSVRI